MPQGSPKLDFAGCSFLPANCIFARKFKESASLQNLIPDLIKTDSKWNLSFCCCITDNSGWLEDEISNIQIPATNEEMFAESVRKGMASISEELEELFRNVENLRRENAHWNIEPRITQFLRNNEIEPSEDESFAKEMRLAALDFAAKRLEGAAVRVRKMIEQCKLKSNDSGRLSMLYYALAITLMESGDLPEARRELLTALSLMHSAPLEPLRSDITDDLGMVYLYQGKVDASLRAHRRALKTNLYLRDQRRVARSCEHMGLVVWKQGEATAALGWLLISLSLRCPLGLAENLANSMDSLGRICSSMKFYSVALELHRNALKHRYALGDEAAIAKTLTNLGVTLRKLDQLPLALHCHQQAMQIRQPYQDKIGIANSYNNLGVVLMKMGRLRSARKQIRKALRLRNEISDSLNMSRNLANLQRIETTLRTKAEASKNYKDKRVLPIAATRRRRHLD